MRLNKIIIFGLTVMLFTGMISGCVFDVKQKNNEAVSDEKPVYVFVAKDIENPYMQKIYDGFKTACDDIGAEALFSGPEGIDGSERQPEIIEKFIDEGVDGIAVAANDADKLVEPLKKALDKGIKVISLDSTVKPDSRMTHIQQVDPEKIGRGLVQAAYEMVDGSGGIAILSTTDKSTNQKLWVEYMEDELEKRKYRNTPLVTIAYGEDDPQKSEEETRKLLENDKITVIIAPTSVGILAAAKVIKETGSDVMLTGLGLPSEMAEYIESGLCKWMYLWNPVDTGYLAAYTLAALYDGSITGEKGDKLKAGKLGTKTVVESADGGTEVILGEPFMFDKNNILEWKDKY